MAEKLMIIDSYSLINRAFFAISASLSTKDGQPTNAVYGMTMMLLRLLQESKPDYFVAAFDVAAPTFRHLEYKDYKGHRLKMEDTLRQQIPVVRQLLEILRIPIYEKAGFEADDVIGTLAVKAASQGLTVEVVTGDRDAFQLVRPGINVLYTRKGITEVDVVNDAYVRERYQLAPGQLIDLKGLTGDTSDNIPGVPGFGEKTAQKYLSQFQNIDGIYEHIEQIAKPRDRELLLQNREQVYLSRRLGRIVTDLDLELNLEECCRHRNFNRRALIAFCREYEFNSLLKKLSENDEGGEVTPSLPELSYQVETTTAGDIPLILKKVKQDGICYFQFLTAAGPKDEVKLLGLGVGTAAENHYIPLTQNGDVNWPAFLSILKDEEITKVGHDLKKQLQIIAAVSSGGCIPPVKGPVEDLMLSGYLINAGIGSLELEELSAAHLRKEIPLVKSERGKAISVFNLPETLPISEQTRVSAARLEAMRRLREVFSSAMEASGVKNLYNDVEIPLLLVLAEMEQSGIQVDPAVLKTFGQNLREEQHTLEAEIFGLVNQEFNLNSPKQLAVILFDKLGLAPPKKNKTGYATDAEVLESLQDAHPVIPKLLLYRVNQKLQSTYIDSLIALISVRDGRVHTSFNQAVTTTGRLSSTDPNLQNIPIRTEEGRMIRRAFVPEHGRKLLAADYSQIELRVMAHFSGDTAFREAFLKGEDIHRWTAAAVHGVPPEQVTPVMRDRAKAVNFGIIYGISGFGLSKNIGVSRKEAENFIEAYFKQYPGVKAYAEKLIDDARISGEARTLLGRIRKLPDLTSRNFTLRSFAERMARNTPIQGTAADIIKLAMVKIGRRLRNNPELGRLLLQVHDELVFEVHEDCLRELAQMVKYEMENAVTLNVPLVVDLKVGINWGDMSKFKLE